MTAPAEPSAPTKVYPLITLVFSLIFPLLLLIIAIMGVSSEVNKNEDF